MGFIYANILWQQFLFLTDALPKITPGKWYYVPYKSPVL